MPSWEAWEPEEAETAISSQARDRRATKCSLQCRTESKTAKRKMSFHLTEFQCPTQQKSWRPSFHVSPPQSRVMAGKEKGKEAGTFFLFSAVANTYLNTFKGLERPRFKYSFVYWLKLWFQVLHYQSHGPRPWSGGGEKAQERKWTGAGEKGLELGAGVQV